MVERAAHRLSNTPPGEWARNLFASTCFPDLRLRARAVEVVAALAARPRDSIPQACESWGATKAAYRFIENERVRFETIQAAVAGATAADCAGHGEILCIQDSTSFSFPTAHQTKGLGPVGHCADMRGVYLHSVLAARSDGVAIGLLHQYCWTRDPERFGQSKETKNKRPIEEKESYKWLRGMREARRVLAENLPSDGEPPPHAIHVGDCESDIHEVFDDAVENGEGLVIRCGSNRRVVGEDGEKGRARDLAARAPLLGKRTIDVPRKDDRPRRKATIEVRACRVTVDPTSPRSRGRRPVPLQLVEVRETNPPEGAKPLCWVLWTNEPAARLEDALRVVDLYKKRWKIEEFHLVLKSGCRIEEVRFETAERIAKVIALYSPVAVRVVQLRDAARLEPDAPCTEVLREEEWRALWTRIHKKPPSPSTRAPTMKQAVLWIGRLGGHLGRKSDGMPGVRTLWRGLRELETMVEIYKILAP